MRAAPGLRIGISQRLTMTPQLLESVRLLQHAGADLNRYVDEQLASNPLLDRAEPEHRDPKAAALDSWSDTGVVWARPSGGHASFTDELEAEQPDLRAHLAEQANVDLPPDDRVTAELLIDLVDANGYLAGFDPLEVAELSRTTVADVLRVLEQLQTFDPPGACARSLAECLRLQLVFRESDSPKMLLLLDHLDLVGEGAEDKLCALLGVSIEDLRALLAELRSLNPRPGLAFAGRREFPRCPRHCRDAEYRRLEDRAQSCVLPADLRGPGGVPRSARTSQRCVGRRFTRPPVAGGGLAGPGPSAAGPVGLPGGQRPGPHSG